MSEVRSIESWRLPEYRLFTIYDLFGEVRKIIAEETKRLDMPWWWNRLEGVVIMGLSGQVPEPSCGTVACLGGWADLLTGGRPFGNSRHFHYWVPYALPDLDWVGLFSPNMSEETILQAGTREYQEAVLLRLDTFMRLNQIILQSKTVGDVFLLHGQ